MHVSSGLIPWITCNSMLAICKSRASLHFVVYMHTASITFSMQHVRCVFLMCKAPSLFQAQSAATLMHVTCYVLSQHYESELTELH